MKNTPPTILVIEDEKNILELIRFHLNQEGYTVLTSMRGDEGLEKVVKEKPQLVLLDLMLPGMDGLEICKSLKQNYKTATIPIIMISAKSQDSDVVLGLELGADDYVTKPFSPRQLTARVKAVLRRLQEKPKDRLLCVGAIELDTARYQVSVENQLIELTSKEFNILKMFMESGGRVFSRTSILEKIWGHDESLNVEDRVVDKHVGELRRKLGSESARIETIKNFGYRLEV
ncbi:MAG: response regulator transcription factor [Candidatus Omnitrophica bacterium]|nr:response regulator transcription factor [Candidatus Omnitrophota bacterium]